MKQLLLLLLISSFLLAACQKNTIESKEPTISFKSMVPNTVVSGSSKDTVFLTFQVNDGDADIGNPQSATTYDILLKDSRDGTEHKMFFPEIPANLKDANKGLSATCTIRISAALYLLLRADHPEADTVSFNVSVQDRAGNESNHFDTPPIYIMK
jgi:hypothetical protein